MSIEVLLKRVRERNVLISKLECLERGANHSLTSNCKFRTLKSRTVTFLSSKPLPILFLFHLFPADINKR